jgi:signal transduction histidine kinase
VNSEHGGTPDRSTPREGADVALVRALFPFCFTIDVGMRVMMAGTRWERFAPEVREGADFRDLFAIERPVGVADSATIAARANDVFLLSLKSRPEFRLRGQFVPRKASATGVGSLFVGGPWLTRIAEMQALGLELEDFPPHDPRGDFLVLLQTQESTLSDLKALAARLRATGSALEARTREMEREMELRAGLEVQLRQSQKMEAIGRLAGGVAHDFNNILMAIHGYAALSLSRVAPNDPVRGWVEQIRTAADRAATLTRQLLAFSRQQVLRPTALDLVHEVREVEKLLRPLIGERIALSVEAEEGVGAAWADSSAVHQILMNLAINARDAMPEGGSLQIRLARLRESPTQSLRAGEFIELTVRDSGIGMDAATKARIFEPFFTTKEVGKGSGLGLATVYGLVEQCGGMVEVESEPGQGACFRVLLPRAEVGAAVEQAGPGRAPEGGRGERILLVEDEPLVRRLLDQLLSRAGYQVVSCAEPAEALAMAQRERYFDLLVTDVVMHGLMGPELARRIEESCGPVPTVFMSGHTDDPMIRSGTLAEHQRFMPKPFAPSELLQVVRELIGRHLPRNAAVL